MICTPHQTLLVIGWSNKKLGGWGMWLVWETGDAHIGFGEEP